MKKLLLLGLAAVALATAGCVTTGEVKPVAITRVPPVYPIEMKIQGRTGSAEVEFVVDTSGTVIEANVLQADSPEFGRAAVEAVQKWKFTPGMRNGVAVVTKSKVTLNFGMSP